MIVGSEREESKTLLPEEDYMALAIQTVLYQKRESIIAHLLSDESVPFIKEITEEIQRRAELFERVSKASIRKPKLESEEDETV